MPTGIRRSRRDAALAIAKQVPQKRAKKGDAEAEKPKMSKTQKFNNQYLQVEKLMKTPSRLTHIEY